MVAESDALCLKSYLYFFSGKPCVSIRGEKDNNTGSVQYYIKYEIGSFDVDLPLGLSVKLGDVWYNLRKSNTNYSDTITVSAVLNPEELLAFTAANKVEIAYTNRARTDHYQLSETQTKSLKDSFVRIQRLLESEKKMQIFKK
ncbi:hypothetical lipoprotein [Leptospira ryugenii]|uniref:Hypothetical lipoprotein n=2 Tax=Leptospira ryugenii TaxID=1917863 RepID=A0A2P2DWC9_9LEPT|nr:hypothetical lipoprotein [Leptospira ryugenii]